MQSGRSRVVIERVSPEIDAGRFPIKRVVGDTVVVRADAFSDGHDVVTVILLHRNAGDADWTETPMHPIGNDRWQGEFTVTEIGTASYTVRGWVDRYQTWARDLAKRVEAGQDLRVDLLIGAQIVDEISNGADTVPLQELSQLLHANAAEAAERALAPETMALLGRHNVRHFATTYERELEITVDPEIANFSAWYELFPRSTGPEGRHGTLRDVVDEVPAIAAMGFNVLYLPPIHPIGESFRKGRNNSVNAEPGEPGSPWAIGNATGGHLAIHPELGTLEDLHHLVDIAQQHGLQLALDIAFNAAPEHPYVKEHPTWFRARPDGTIQYAENPPKKYQDIYPFDFESDDWAAMWDELKHVFTYWCEQGVRIFRVDNPHTKAFGFWEWCIGAVKQRFPDAVFLSEAFTRPKVMYRLAKAGFSQSYTYFTWRTTGRDLREYLEELVDTEVAEYFRPNFWPNTPDILPEHLQHGGKAAFKARLILAATLSSNYGVYGPAYEAMEATPNEPGREEYLDSEKYEIRHWPLEPRAEMRELMTVVNTIRINDPALHNTRSLRFHPTDNDQLLAYSKSSPDGTHLVLTVVNMDPFNVQSGWLTLPLADFGIDAEQPYQMHDLLGGGRYIWRGATNFVKLDPHAMPAHIFEVRRFVKRESDFDYFD